MERESILIVDGDRRFAADLARQLGEHYRVRSAFSGPVAMDLAKRNAPSLMVIGYLEPRGESFRLHRQIREDRQLCRIPLLVVDVHPNEHSRKGWRRHEGMQMDAEGYMSRPVALQELQAEVKRILQSRSLRYVEWQEALERKARGLVQEAVRWSDAASA